MSFAEHKSAFAVKTQKPSFLSAVETFTGVSLIKLLAWGFQGRLLLYQFRLLLASFLFLDLAGLSLRIRSLLLMDL